METHEAEVLEAKARGTFDEGVVSLTAESVTMSAGYPRVVHTDEQSGATTQLCRISIDRGVTFQSVLDKLTQFTKLCHTTGHDVSDENGIWVSTRITAKERGEDGKETSRPWILCATEIWRTHAMGRRTFRCVSFYLCVCAIRLTTCFVVYRIRRPYNSDSPSLSREHLLKNYRKLSAEELGEGGTGEATWRFWYNRGTEPCIHGERCQRRSHGKVCKVGRRVSEEHLLTGAVLPVWQQVAAITSSNNGVKHKGGANKIGVNIGSPPGQNHEGAKRGVLRVIRTETDDGKLILGLHLHKDSVELLEKRLADLSYAERERRASQMEEDERLTSPMRREGRGPSSPRFSACDGDKDVDPILGSTYGQMD